MKKIFYIAFIFIASIAFAQSPVPPGAKLDTVARGFQQAEGPVWKDGAGLLFSDIARSTIYLWSPATQLTTTYLHPSDSSNGLTLDLQGKLILTQMQKQRVARQETDGTITPLASTYKGKTFNSPNDVVVKSDGSVYFTDPDFNVPVGKTRQSIKGIYRIGPSGDVRLLDSTMTLPNGICFSLDETRLYVNESQQGIIYVWDVVDDTTISNKTRFWTCPNGGYLDGMKVDGDENIYCAGPTGIWIVSPSGTLLGRILTPQGPSNCAWGDADKKTLYITSNNFVYKIRLAPTTIEDRGSAMPQKYDLKTGYPNPFNPSTTISYSLPERADVRIDFIASSGEVINSRNLTQSAGRYTMTWDAHGYASGVYFCRFHAEGKSIYEKTEKLILLR